MRRADREDREGKGRHGGWRRAAAWAVLFASPAPVLAQEPRGDIDATMAEVRALVDSEKWAKAKERLLAAVAADAGGDGVPFHWAEVEETLARCSFWEDYEVPKPKEVVGGELLSYDAKSGAIKLVYKGDAEGLSVGRRVRIGKDGEPKIEEGEGDFLAIEDSSGDESYIHPMVFKGPYKVEIQGRPRNEEGKFPVVLVGWDWKTVCGVVFSYLVSIVEIDGTSQRVIASRSGGGYGNLGVRVNGSSVSAFCNDRLIAKGQRSSSEWGQFGFTGLHDIERVEIVGEIEPSWVTGLVDEEVQRAFAEFRKSYDPFAELPAGLRVRVRGEAKRIEIGEHCPTRDPEDLERWKETQEILEEAGPEKGLEYVRKETEEGSWLRDWLCALLSMYAGDSEASWQSCERVCAARPDFLEGRLLRARLMGWLRSLEDARYELEELVLGFPEYVDPYEDLARIHLALGEFDEAREVVEEALREGIPPEALAGVERNRLRALYGPHLRDASEFVTKNYRVVSDLGSNACYEIATELEKFYRKYNVRLRRISGVEPRKFQVYVFSGLAGYESYCEDLSGDKPESELGRYVPSLKQLLVWNSPDERMMMRTVRHEGFHQYLDQLASEAPVWLHEGMAEYYEEARLENGNWKDGQVNGWHVALLHETQEWTPLQRLVQLDARAFRSNSALHYSEAWAFVHFLLHHDRDTKKLFDAFLDALVGGAKRKEALDRAFGAVDWKALEQDFHEYVKAL